jgi:hypothetical protein
MLIGLLLFTVVGGLAVSDTHVGRGIRQAVGITPPPPPKGAAFGASTAEEDAAEIRRGIRG